MFWLSRSLLVVFVLTLGLAATTAWRIEEQLCALEQRQDVGIIPVKCPTVNCFDTFPCDSAFADIDGITWQSCECEGLGSGNAPCYGANSYAPGGGRICIAPDGCPLLEECEVQTAGATWAPMCLCE